MSSTQRDILKIYTLSNALGKCVADASSISPLGETRDGCPDARNEMQLKIAIQKIRETLEYFESKK